MKNVLKSFVPLLVLFLVKDIAAKPCFARPLEVSGFPTGISPSPSSSVTTSPTFRRETIVGGSGYASGLNYNTNIGGIITGHTGNNNGPQIGNNASVFTSAQSHNTKVTANAVASDKIQFPE